MLEIDPSVIVHQLNVLFCSYPSEELGVCTGARQGHRRRGLQIIGSRFHTKSVLSQMAGQHSDG